MAYNTLTTAFRGGVIARIVGMGRSENPYLHDNLTEQQATHWIDGFNQGGVICFDESHEEVIQVVNSCESKHVKMLRFTNLTLIRPICSPRIRKLFLGEALKNAEAYSDGVFLRDKIATLNEHLEKTPP